LRWTCHQHPDDSKEHRQDEGFFDARFHLFLCSL
jgi:hypothetical protein